LIFCADVLKIAKGRVYTGKEAKKLNLVDSIGGIEETVKQMENLLALVCEQKNKKTREKFIACSSLVHYQRETLAQILFRTKKRNSMDDSSSRSLSSSLLAPFSFLSSLFSWRKWVEMIVGVNFAKGMGKQSALFCYTLPHYVSSM